MTKKEKIYLKEILDSNYEKIEVVKNLPESLEYKRGFEIGVKIASELLEMFLDHNIHID